MNENSQMIRDDLIQAALDLKRLVSSQQTLLLATSSSDGVPDISYAPFVRDQQGHFFIFVSELTSHTVHLLSNPKASVMFIHPEAQSRNLFARERAIYSCSVMKIGRDDGRYTRRLDAMQERFGEILTLLRTLSDFHLFELCPENGRYIAGFGKAFTIDLSDGSVSPVSNP